MAIWQRDGQIKSSGIVFFAMTGGSASFSFDYAVNLMPSW